MLVSLRSSGAEWMPRAWVELATRLLVAGTTGVLVGTRGLLGEGWNCPQVNVLVDLGVAATSVSTQQARGRSLRLDPRDPEKLASNWDVVCVAPDLVRGTADYERFVRRHLHLFAPAEDGEIEAGPSHVHPELGPFAPPAVERFAAVNRDMIARARDREAARERWRIGTPYRAQELRTIVARPHREPAPRRSPRASRSRSRACRSSSACRSARAPRARCSPPARPRPPARRCCSPGSRSRPPGPPSPRCACAARPRASRSCCRSTPPPARSPTPTSSSASSRPRPPPRWSSSRARAATCAAR